MKNVALISKSLKLNPLFPSVYKKIMGIFIGTICTCSSPNGSLQEGFRCTQNQINVKSFLGSLVFSYERIIFFTLEMIMWLASQKKGEINPQQYPLCQICNLQLAPFVPGERINSSI